MRALVTGGTGFLGSFLVRRWADRHGTDAVACLVPLEGTPAETATRAAFERDGIACIEGDLRAQPVADDLHGPVDVVFHLAAATDTSWPEERLAPINVQGTANLLETVKEHLTGPRRIIFTSTSAAVDRRRRPWGRPLTETSPCHPRTAYGRTKLAAEHLLQDWCAREAAHFTIARLTTLYGPGVRTGLIPVLIEGLRERRLSTRLNFPGRVSMLYVEDAVRLLLALAENPAAADQIYFLSSGEALKVADLIKRLANLDAALAGPIRLPRWFWWVLRQIAWCPGLNRLVPWRLLHILDDGLWCDNRKVKKVCPFDLVQIEEGLRRTLAPAPALQAPCCLP